jgi:hypothetical protein
MCSCVQACARVLAIKRTGGRKRRCVRRPRCHRGRCDKRTHMRHAWRPTIRIGPRRSASRAVWRRDFLFGTIQSVSNDKEDRRTQGRTVCDIRPPGIADASLEPVAFVAAHRLGRETARCTFRSGRLVAESDTGTGPKPIIIGPRGCNTVKCAAACAYHELASIGCVPTTHRRSRITHLVFRAQSAAGI